MPETMYLLLAFIGGIAARRVFLRRTLVDGTERSGIAASGLVVPRQLYCPDGCGYDRFLRSFRRPLVKAGRMPPRFRHCPLFSSRDSRAK